MSQVVIKEENAEQTTSSSNVAFQTSSDLHGTDIKVEESVGSSSERNGYHHEAEINNIVIKSEPIEYEESADCNNHLEDAPIVLPIDLESKEDLRCKLEAITDVQNICNVLVMKNSETFPKALKSSEDFLSFELRLGPLKRFANKQNTDNGSFPFYYNCDRCCYKTQVLSSFKNHYKLEHMSALHPCKECSVLLLSNLSLKYHVDRLHRSINTFACSKCDFSGNTKKSLERHRIIKHGQKKYKCANCDYRCYNKSALQGHQISSHPALISNLKAHLCHICHKPWRSLKELSRHLRTHSGIRPYSCDVCNFKTSQRSYLRRHKIAKHTQSTQNFCSRCFMQFTNQSRFDKHKKSQHPDFKCQLCSFKSSWWRDLAKHCKLVHSNADEPQKPFKCSKCPSSFVRKDSLKRHIDNALCSIIHPSKTYDSKGASPKSSSTVEPKLPFEEEKVISKKNKAAAQTSSKDLKNKMDKFRVCDACNEQFSSLKVLKRHLKYCVFQ